MSKSSETVHFFDKPFLNYNYYYFFSNIHRKLKTSFFLINAEQNRVLSAHLFWRISSIGYRNSQQPLPQSPYSRHRGVSIPSFLPASRQRHFCDRERFSPPSSPNITCHTQPAQPHNDLSVLLHYPSNNRRELAAQGRLLF